jgi:8-amino-7-oxononanoate synthase
VKRETPLGLRHLDADLAELSRHGLLRTRPDPTSADHLSFCSNDYLGLAARPAPPETSGAGASRLVVGERTVHVALEEEAAHLVGLPAALVFTSGYAANVGVLSALAGPGDLIVSDALNHASLIDGARLSRARVVVTPHLDVDAVAAVLAERGPGRAFVVTESYFSMDADSPDLGALRQVCDTAQAALVVDEAHALGVLGPDGRGLCAAAGVRADVLVGTFGKAFGAGGAFAAGCPALVEWLWNRARSFVFSTGLSPVVAAAALHGMRTAGAEPHRRRRVLAAAERFRSGLAGVGVRPRGHGPIIPWVVGDASTAVAVARGLVGRGVDARPIRPPSVPLGTARIRFTVTAAHDDAEIDRAVAAVAGSLRLEEIRPALSPSVAERG